MGRLERRCWTPLGLRLQSSSGLFVRSLRLRGESESTAVSRFASGTDEAPPLSMPESTPLELHALVGSSRVREDLPRRNPRSHSVFPRFREPFAHPRRHGVLYAAYAAGDAVDRSETSGLLKPRATAYDFQRTPPSQKINRNLHVDRELISLRIFWAASDDNDPTPRDFVDLATLRLAPNQIAPGDVGGQIPASRDSRDTDWAVNSPAPGLSVRVDGSKRSVEMGGSWRAASFSATELS